MYGCFQSFCNFFLKSYTFLMVIVFTLFASSMVYAADPVPVEVEVNTPSIDWGTVASDLVGALTEVAVVGLGIAISLWVLFLIARVFKRSAT